MFFSESKMRNKKESKKTSAPSVGWGDSFVLTIYLAALLLLVYRLSCYIEILIFFLNKNKKKTMKWTKRNQRKIIKIQEECVRLTTELFV